MKKEYEPPAITDLGGAFEQATGWTPVGRCGSGSTNKGGNCQNGSSHSGVGACITGRYNYSGGGGCIGGRFNYRP